MISKSIKDEKDSFFEEYEYDGKNNKISQKDFYENFSKYNYDSLGNILEEISPAVENDSGDSISPIITYQYDSLSNQIKKTDPNGNSTHTSYNIFNKPIKIEYPDKTFEEFEYNLDGTLKKHIDQRKTKIEYFYDCFKRVISKNITSEISDYFSEESYEYDFFNLLSKTDSEGNITKYTYDEAGRKIKEEFFSKDRTLLSKEEFFYDELGFLHRTIKADCLITILKRDFLGRILEEKQQDLNGNEIRKVQYEYGDENHKQTTISYISGNESKEIKTFDSLDRLIKIEDALKNETNYFYDVFYNEKLKQNLKRITIVNPLQQKVIKTFDSLDREKTIEIVNPDDKTISHEEKFYDLNGNLTNQISSIYIKPGKKLKTITTKWKYDNMNRLIQLIEACGYNNSKITKYFYTDKGEIRKIIKPDQSELFYEYDYVGNNTRLYSSKVDIDYIFQYNKLKQVILAKDLNNNLITKRKYDPFGNLLEEDLSNCLSISHEYDLLQNKTKTIFRDGFIVDYQYDPINLRKIIRKDKNGNELYKHEYLKYDLSGNLLKENILFDSSDIDYSIDDLSRISKIKTKFHTQEVKYDSIGKISNIRWKNFLEDESSFLYDDLNQIISETGLFSNKYLFDSHNNRILKNEDFYKVNNLNQITATKDFIFEYDKNGNPIQQITSDCIIFYEYDSLDRLIKVINPFYTLIFTYDPFNRRMSKFTKYDSFIKTDDLRYFLYDNQNEIGSYDHNLNQKELRVLSNTQKAEIGSSISFEIDDYVYAPIYDVSGNVVSLIYNGSLYEHYRYSVFGEKMIFSKSGSEIKKSSIDNPWQFSSKRIDEETGLIFFGRRYYYPKIGRWLTCDPKGFQDGLNLYAFVLNNPLNNIDLYGLSIKNFIKKSFNSQKSLDFLPLNIVDLIEELNISKDPTRKFDLQRKEFSGNIRIGFINGVRTTSKEAKKYAEELSEISGGYNVHVLYNETYNSFIDVARAKKELYNNYESKAVKLLKEDWIDFLSANSLNRCLECCHSEGAIITRNALKSMPEEYRNKIYVIAIAPGAYIDKELCNGVIHAISKNDVIPFIDKKGLKYNKATAITLEPHPSAKGIDHNFDSMTYKDIKNYSINYFIRSNNR